MRGRNGVDILGLYTIEEGELLPDDVIVRQSTINSMRLCSAREGYKSHPLYVDIFSEPIFFGSIVHKVIEDYLMGLYDAKLKPELVEYAYLDVLKEYGNPVEIRPEQRSDILSEALRAARLWEKRVAGNLPDPPFLIEETAYCVLYVDEHTMRRVVMQGTADLVSPEQGIIVDWKTSKRPWDQSKADMTIQAEVYCGLMSAKLQQKFHKMHFWVYERGNAKWSKIETTRDDASIESTFKTAVQYGKQMLAGVYPATPTVEQFGKVKRGWYCSTRYCPAWNACEYKFLNDDVNEHDVKIVSL